MKKTLLIALSALIVSTSFGQVTARLGQHDAPASWRPSHAAPIASSATSVAPTYVAEIIETLGLKANFEVKAARIDNAAAVVYGGKRYLLYNPTFIDNLVHQTGNKWAAVSVLAHEIGHHLNGHTVTGSGSHPAIELEADEFSGFVLRKMGASLGDAQAAMKVLAGHTASRTHPAQYDRLTSIAKGWQKADDQAAGRYTAKVPDLRPGAPATTPRQNTAVTQRPAVSRTSASSQALIGRVRFHADPNAHYFVTSHYTLVKVANNRAYTIGKLSRLNSQAYPYVIHDRETQLLVDYQGTILTRTGKQVGVLTPHQA